MVLTTLSEAFTAGRSVIFKSGESAIVNAWRPFESSYESDNPYRTHESIANPSLALNLPLCRHSWNRDRHPWRANIIGVNRRLTGQAPESFAFSSLLPSAY